MERPDRVSTRPGPSRAVVLSVAAVATLLTAIRGPSSGGPPDPPAVEDVKAKVPGSGRSDAVRPRFSQSTAITNPLLPVSQLTQVIQLGSDSGQRVRFETTLLPGTRAIEWDGGQVETVATQAVAYAAGWVVEVAVDFYAQADDGSVWHFGEEVRNYDEGVLVDRDGSWIAGPDVRPGMAMPATPRVGDAFRSGATLSQGADQVTVTSVGQTVDGPRGPVGGALRIQENRLDGTIEDKTYAPGYGELRAHAASQDEVHGVALALPTDGRNDGVPPELATLSSHAAAIVGDRHPAWDPTLQRVNEMTALWSRLGEARGAGMLESQMGDRLATLVAAVGARRPGRLDRAAIDVAEAVLDLQLRYRAPADVDRNRLGLWVRQLRADAADLDPAAVRGDLVVIDALWARLGGSAHPAEVTVETSLAALRAASEAGDLAQAAAVAGSLPFA